ncbi:MAG: hypothetical protein AAGG68_21790 [Bacteroidota bacterium]
MKNLWLLLIILIALAIRILGIFWGNIDKPTHNLWEPDEFQHAQIAEQQIHILDEKLYADKDFSSIWNTRAYGKQVGISAYIAYQIGWLELKQNKLILVGRFLSTFYAVLLILVVFQLGKLLLRNESVALLAALFIAIFDLNITYSHYAVPAISYIFWTHLSLLATYIFLKAASKNDVFFRQIFYYILPFPFAMSLATKLDFIPLLIFLTTLALLAFQKKMSIQKSLLTALIFIVLVVFYLIAIHGFHVDIAEAIRSSTVAKDLNSNVIPKDNHWLHNPLLYLAATIGGSSLFVVVLASISTTKLLSKSWRVRSLNEQTICLLLFLLFLALEFLVRWRMDTPFVRRANVFLPYVALLAAYRLNTLFQNKKLKNAAKVIVAFYTLGLAIVSQYNFWNDTRYQSRAFLKEQLQGAEKINYSMYAFERQMPKQGAKLKKEADILVLHEAAYGRYWKMFTTPFKMPKCCEEVYHCDKQNCKETQEILLRKTDFELLKSFETLELFPERILFKHYFGTYETFLGEVRIYRR